MFQRIRTTVKKISRQKVKKIAGLVCVIYVASLAGSYLLLSNAQSDWNHDYVYWQMATSISAEVDDHYDATTQRPQASGNKWSCPRTHSLAVWTVLNKWIQTRENDHDMTWETSRHLEWVLSTIDRSK